MGNTTLLISSSNYAKHHINVCSGGDLCSPFIAIFLRHPVCVCVFVQKAKLLCYFHVCVLSVWAMLPLLSFYNDYLAADLNHSAMQRGRGGVLVSLHVCEVCLLVYVCVCSKCVCWCMCVCVCVCCVCVCVCVCGS